MKVGPIAGFQPAASFQMDFMYDKRGGVNKLSSGILLLPYCGKFSVHLSPVGVEMKTVSEASELRVPHLYQPRHRLQMYSPD